MIYTSQKSHFATYTDGTQGIAYTLSLNNDYDTVVFDQQNNLISSLPVVKATRQLNGDTTNSTGDFDLSITPKNTWTENTHYTFDKSSGVLTIEEIPTNFTEAAFLIQWNISDSSTLTKTFTLKKQVSNVDYEIETNKNVINSTNLGGTVNIKVKKKDINGSKYLAANDLEIDSLTLDSNQTLTWNSDGYWTFDYDKGYTEAVTVTLKQDTLVWDIEIIEFVSDGATGRSIKKVTEYYLLSDKSTGVTANEVTSTEIQSPTKSKKYLWNCEQVTYSDGTSDAKTTPVIIAYYTENGRSVTSITNKYLVSSIGNIKKDDIGNYTWSGTPGATDPVNKYLWNYEVITYTNGDGTTATESTDPAIIGTHGDSGNSLMVKYINSAIKPTITNNNVSDWSDTIPTVETGKHTYMTQKMSNAADWSEPVQISANDGTTPKVEIIDGYWYINGEQSIKAEGKDGDTPVITIGSNGNWFIDGVDSNQKAQGDAGKDGDGIKYVYYRSNSPINDWTGKQPNDKKENGWTDSPQGITETNQYEYVSISTKTVTSGTTATWSTFSTPIIWSKWGEKGQDGDGVSYEYYLSNSATAPSYNASDSKWTDEPTGVSKDNQYEYVVQIKTTTKDGKTTSTQSGVALWAKWSEDGTSPYLISFDNDSATIGATKDGSVDKTTLANVSKVTVTVYFGKDDITNGCNFNWSVTANSTLNSSNGRQNWFTGLETDTATATVSVTLKDGTPVGTKTFTISKSKTGQTGDDAVTYKLSVSPNSVNLSTSSGGVSPSFIVTKYSGSTITDITNSTTLYTITRNDGKNQNEKITGKTIFTLKVNNVDVDTETVEVVADGTPGEGVASVVNYYLATDKDSGVTTSTNGWNTKVPSNFNSTNKYLWNYEQTLNTDGGVISTTEPTIIGTWGTDGRGISSIEEYYATTTTTNQPAKGDWKKVPGNPMPITDSTNKYLWNYEKIIYTTGNPTTTEPAIIGTYGDTGVGIQGTKTESVRIYLINNSTTANKPVFSNDRKTLPDGWSETEPDRLSNTNKYIWSCTGTKSTTYSSATDTTGETKYNEDWTTPELYKAYLTDAVKDEKAATFYKLFGMDAENGKEGIEYDGKGNAYINASLIQTGALVVRSDGINSGIGDVIFSAGVDDSNTGVVNIAGWQVTQNSIKIKDKEIGDSGSFYLGTENQSEDKRVGGVGANSWRLTIGEHFGVISNGSLYASGGAIGGWNIWKGTLYSESGDDKVTLYSRNLQDNEKFAIGNSDELKNWRIVAGKQFGVTNDGSLYCSNANIEGTLTTGTDGTYTRIQSGKVENASLKWELMNGGTGYDKAEFTSGFLKFNRTSTDRENGQPSYTSATIKFNPNKFETPNGGQDYMCLFEINTPVLELDVQTMGRLAGDWEFGEYVWDSEISGYKWNGTKFSYLLEKVKALQTTVQNLQK